MLPISTGRSPKIDQLYQSMRSYHKSSASLIDSDEQQDRSIQHIRNIGKQLLSTQKIKPSGKYPSQNKKMYETLRNPLKQAQQQSYDNLYDKYRKKYHKKHQNMIQNRKKAVIKTMQSQNILNNHKKYWKNPKYQDTQPKIYNKNQFGVRNLNYVKRTDRKAQQENQIKRNIKNATQKIQESGKYYDRYGIKRANKKIQIQGFKGVLQRGQSMIQHRNNTANKLRLEKMNKIMDGVTFSPQRISKRYQTLEKSSLQQRIYKNNIHRNIKQKYILLQQTKNHTYSPKLNPNTQTNSVVKKIWQSSKNKNHDKRQKRFITQQQTHHTYQNHIKQSKDQISQQPTNHTKVLVKNVQELSSIFHNL